MIIRDPPGDALRLRRRKMLEEAFGWVKEIGPLRHALARGLDRIGAHALLNFSAYQLTPDEIGQSAGTVIRGQH